MKKTDMDNRIDEALKQDAAGFSALSNEVPPTLRTLIASTPAATTAPFIASSSATAARIFTTKLALWSAGGVLVIAAAYFAFSTDDQTPISSQPEPTLTPIVIAVDTPKPARDTSSPAYTKTPATPKLVTPTSPDYTQAQIDSMMRALPEPATTVHERDSISGTLKRK